MTGQSYKRNPSVTPTCTAPPPPHTQPHTHTLSLSSAARSTQPSTGFLVVEGSEALSFCSNITGGFSRFLLLQTKLCTFANSLASPSAKTHLVPLNPTETSRPGPPGDPCHQPVKSKSHILFIQDPSGGWGEGGGRWGRSLQQQADQSQSCPPKRTDTHQTGRSALLHA